MAKKLRAETKGEEMEYVKFGKPGLGVSRLCIGCMTYGIPNPRSAPLDARRGKEPAADQEGARSRHI
jgi:aryl-alcohol dehydrogenase-like predicted oxidoreductase